MSLETNVITNYNYQTTIITNIKYNYQTTNYNKTICIIITSCAIYIFYFLPVDSMTENKKKKKNFSLRNHSKEKNRRYLPTLVSFQSAVHFYEYKA